MSQFYFPQPTMPQHNFNSHQGHSHHGGRSRRGQRFGGQQNQHKQFKQPRPVRDNAEALQAASVRKDFEAARSFDLEDDELFCPWHLLTEDDLHSIHSASSDRSSSSSGGSPETSPLQHQLQPTPAFSLSQPQMPGNPYQQGNSAHLKIHAPLAQRSRNAIPIVDPNSRHTSPPMSISPARQVQKPYNPSRRW